MKTNTLMMSLALAAIVVAVGVMMPVAYAAGSDTKAAEPKGSDTKAAEMKDMKCTVTGKVEVKTEKVDGKDAKVTYVKAASVKGEDGKAMEKMKGMTLKVTGAKAADAEKLAGKEVQITGMVKGGKEISADSVTEQKKAGSDTK